MLVSMTHASLDVAGFVAATVKSPCRCCKFIELNQ
jgi:hypothetical protein